MKLRVMDFDDTLVKTNSRVRYTDSKGKVHSLTPAEYAVYNKKPTDVFDYSDFDGDLIEPASILIYNRIFRNFLNDSGKRKIAILTARANPRPVRDFLRWSGIDEKRIEIIALGDSNPEKKREWIEDQIKLGYDDIIFFDDSYKNIAHINKLKSKYKGIKLITRLVEEMGTQLNEMKNTAPKNSVKVTDISEFLKMIAKLSKGENLQAVNLKGMSAFKNRAGNIVGAFDTDNDEGWIIKESLQESSDDYMEMDTDEILEDIIEKAEEILEYDFEFTDYQAETLSRLYYEMCDLFDSIPGDVDKMPEWDAEPEVMDHLGFGKQYEETIDEATVPVTITQKEWNKVHKDFKSDRNGQKYMLQYDPKLGTISVPVIIKD